MLPEFRVNRDGVVVVHDPSVSRIGGMAPQPWRVVRPGLGLRYHRHLVGDVLPDREVADWDLLTVARLRGFTDLRVSAKGAVATYDEEYARRFAKPWRVRFIPVNDRGLPAHLDLRVHQELSDQRVARWVPPLPSEEGVA